MRTSSMNPPNDGGPDKNSNVMEGMGGRTLKPWAAAAPFNFVSTLYRQRRRGGHWREILRIMKSSPSFLRSFSVQEFRRDSFSLCAREIHSSPFIWQSVISWWMRWHFLRVEVREFYSFSVQYISDNMTLLGIVKSVINRWFSNWWRSI